MSSIGEADDAFERADDNIKKHARVGRERTREEEWDRRRILLFR